MPISSLEILSQQVNNIKKWELWIHHWFLKISKVVLWQLVRADVQKLKQRAHARRI